MPQHILLFHPLHLATAAQALAAVFVLGTTAGCTPDEGKVYADFDALIEDLPDGMTDSYVLMHTSQSQHRSSLAHPRAILFGLDARQLVAFSSDPDDPRYNTVEVATNDESTGTWKFQEINFDDPEPQLKDGVGCTECHGSPAQPIWGSYPEWPGAIGNTNDELTEAEAERLRLLKREPDARLGVLRLTGDERLVVGWPFSLPRRDYPYANTVFNMELGVVQSQAIVTALPPDTRRDALRDVMCEDLDLREFAVHVAADGFDLAAFYGGDAGYYWFSANEYIGVLVTYLLLLDVAADDDAVAAAARDSLPEMKRLYDVWWGLRGDDRAGWLQTARGSDDDDLDARALLDPIAQDVCRALGGS